MLVNVCVSVLVLHVNALFLRERGNDSVTW